MLQKFQLCVKTLGANINSDLPRIFYVGKTKPMMNLPEEIFDEFSVGKLVLPR